MPGGKKMPEEKAELPGELVAGTTVIYHLDRSWKAGDNPHRVGIVSGVRRGGSLGQGELSEGKDGICVDITVFLQPDDGDYRDTLVAIRDAEYDPECPAGTFCLATDGGTDELMSVANWQAQMDRDRADREVKNTERKHGKGKKGAAGEDDGNSQPGAGAEAGEGKDGKESAENFNAQVQGPELSGSERKASLEGETVGEVKAETPKFDKPAERT